MVSSKSSNPERPEAQIQRSVDDKDLWTDATSTSLGHPSTNDSKYLKLRFDGRYAALPWRPTLSSVTLPANLIRPLMIVLHVAFKVVEFGTLGALSAENITLDPPGQDLECLIRHMGLGWHSEDVVEFFQSALFGLRDQEEDHHQGGDVEEGIESEGSLR